MLSIIKENCIKTVHYRHRCFYWRVIHTFPIINFPFISSNIPASPAYGVYISQMKRYSRACDQYSDFLERAQLLTQKLLKQGYVAPRLKLSLQIFYCRHHDLVDRYEISISPSYLYDIYAFQLVLPYWMCIT
jgi:hypothetical protein